MPGSVPHAAGILDEARKLISCDLLPTAIVGEILKVYQPGDRPTTLRLPCGPTLALATLRAPSAEALLLAVRLGRDFTSRVETLSVVSRTAALMNEYLSARFVQSHATASDVTSITHAKPRIRLVRS